MKTSPFRRFNQPEVVSHLCIDLLREFLQRFEHDLKARQVSLPILTLSEADYYKSASALLGKPETLPEAMVEALLAIEEMASPEQSQRREAAFWESPQELWIDGKSSPENVALHLWLWAPYPRTQTPASPVASTALPPAQPSTPAPAIAAPPIPLPRPLAPRTPPKALSPVRPPQALPPGSPAIALLARTPEVEPKRATGHRRNGKVAHLRADLRNKVSEMIEDGFTYPEIIEEFAKDGVELNEVNLCNWKPGGHQDWLRARERREALEARQDFKMDLVRENAGANLLQAGRQLASTHICELLDELDHAALGKGIASEPMAFTRLLNAMSRLTADELACARYRAEEAQRQEQWQKDHAPQIPPEDRCITKETLQKIEKQLHIM